MLLALFALHYVNRTLIFPLKIRGGKPTPLTLFLAALLFCVANGYIQMRALCTLHPSADGWERHPQFLAGVALFVVGWYINVDSDAILRNLRRPGETG